MNGKLADYSLLPKELAGAQGLKGPQAGSGCLSGRMLLYTARLANGLQGLQGNPSCWIIGGGSDGSIGVEGHRGFAC